MDTRDEGTTRLLYVSQTQIELFLQGKQATPVSLGLRVGGANRRSRVDVFSGPVTLSGAFRVQRRSTTAYSRRYAPHRVTVCGSATEGERGSSTRRCGDVRSAQPSYLYSYGTMIRWRKNESKTFVHVTHRLSAYRVRQGRAKGRHPTPPGGL